MFGFLLVLSMFMFVWLFSYVIMELIVVVMVNVRWLGLVFLSLNYRVVFLVVVECCDLGMVVKLSVLM